MSHGLCIHFETRQSRCFKMGHMLLTLFTTCIVVTSSVKLSDNVEHPVVQTSLGSIQGSFLHVPGKDVDTNVYQFAGIPFAKPPVGELRFKKPEPVEPWTGTYQATKFSDICVQSIKAWELAQIQSGGDPNEDCLYLNIWTPELSTPDHNPKKDVMVYFYGGAFKGGSASQPFNNAAFFASLGDVVVVAPNYRVGILGFLNAGTEEAPGNQGLWDQRLALMWVRDHIDSFGGDPDHVTIFGVSAGSLSVGAHLLSPLSRGLFHRAIMQSGSPINPVLIHTPDRALTATMKFAKKQQCLQQSEDNNDALSDVVKCLKQLQTSKFTESEDETFFRLTNPYAIPTYGDEFLPASTRNSKAEVDYDTVDLMIGITANEGSLFVYYDLESLFRHFDLTETAAFTVSEAKEFVEKKISDLSAQESQNVIQEAISFYFRHLPSNVSSDDLKQLSGHVIGDYMLSCPSMFFAEYFSLENPVYFYHFNYSSGTLGEWTGVNHGEDQSFIFRETFFPNVTLNDEELEFSRHLVQLWTTFAKTGEPTVPGVERWPRYSEDNPVFVDLKPKHFTTGIGPRLRECNFWRCHLQRP